MSKRRLAGRDMETVARMMADDYGVEVVCSGTACLVDGKKIHLPSLPVQIEDAAALSLVRSYLDHELGHIIGKSKASLLEKISGTHGDLGRWVLNGLEDVRVNAVMAAKWPGSAINLREGDAVLVGRWEEKANGQEKAKAEDNGGQVAAIVVYAIGRGLPKLPWIDGEAWERAAAFGDRIRAVDRAKSTAALVPLAIEITEAFRPPDPPEPEKEQEQDDGPKETEHGQPDGEPDEEQDKSEQGEKAGGGDEGMEQKEADSGSGDGEGEDAGELGSSDGDSGDSEGDTGGDGGDKPADDGDDSGVEGAGGAAGDGGGDEGGAGGNAAGSGGGDGSAGAAGGGTDPSAGEGSPGGDKHKSFAGGVVGGELGKAAEEQVAEAGAEEGAIGMWRPAHRGMDQIFTAEEYHEVVIHGNEMQGFGKRARRAGGPIRQRLAMLLQAEERNFWRGGRTRGRPDPARLAKLAAGLSMKVMRQKIEHKGRDTACCLLVDGSGSMNRAGGGGNGRLDRLHTAMLAAAAFGHILEAAGHKSEIAMFTGPNAPREPSYQITTERQKATARRLSGGLRAKCAAGAPRIDGTYLNPDKCRIYTSGVVLVALKDYSTPMRTAEPWLAKATTWQGGGTPMGAAISVVIRDLLARQERRKVLMVYTDGQPTGSPLHVHEACLHAEKVGIEVVLIGIGTSCVRSLHHKYAVVHDLECLGKTTIRELAKALDAGRHTGHLR